MSSNYLQLSELQPLGLFYSTTVGSGVFNPTSGETAIGVSGNDWGVTRLAFNGTLKTSVDNAMPSDTDVQFGWHVQGSSRGTLDLNGTDQTVGGLSVSPSHGPIAGSDQTVTDTSGSGTLTVNVASGSKSYYGNFEGGVSLVKTGAGTQILDNISGVASANTGTTTVSNGVLQVGSNVSLSPNSAHTVASGGTLKLDGNIVAIGSLAGGGTVENGGVSGLIDDDFSSGSIGTEGRIYESRLDAGWKSTSGWGANPASEWAITGGRLENPSVNTTYYSASETPAWQWWTNPDTNSRSTTLTVSFDYATDGADTLTAHFWAVQTGGAAGANSFISNNQGWANGNSGQNQDTTSGGYDTFNLLDGDTTPDNGDHITGHLNGSGTFTMTIDVSALGIADVTTVGDIDTLFIAFAANETGGGTTWVDNLSIVAGDTSLIMGEDNTSPTFSGTLQDGAGGSPLGIAKVGTGTQTLSGINTYTGGTSIEAGTLTIGGAGQLGSGSYTGAIRNAASLSFESSANQTLSGVISGAGNLTLDPPTGEAATLTLSNPTNSFSGGVTVVGENVSPGVILNITAAGAAGTGALNPDGWGAYFQNGSGGTLTLSNPLTADAFFRINSISEMHLAGTVTASGSPIIACNNGSL